MASDPLNPEYVEEAPDSGEYARQTKRWVESYPKTKLDEFVAEVTLQAKTAVTSANQANQAAAAANRDAGRCSTLVEEAKQQVGLAQGQVQQAEAARGAAEIQALEAKKFAQAANASAVLTDELYKKTKALVDGFDPYRNQYGYSPIVVVNTDTYYVTKADIGKTLLFMQTGRLVLPSSNFGDFEEHFFLHATVFNPDDRILVDRDIRTTIKYGSECIPILSELRRGTMQLASPDNWLLFDLERPRFVDLVFNSDENDQQVHGNYSKRVGIEGSWVYSLSKKYGMFRGAVHDVASGSVKVVNYLVGQAVDLPDGDIEVGYSSTENYTAKVAFGVYGKHDTLGQQLGWYWGDSGLRGTLFPFQIEGHSGADWFIIAANGDFKNPSKTIWVRLEHRILKEANGSPKRVSLNLTSTDGFSWFENRYAKLNARLADGEIVLGNFPEIVLERGHLYTLLKTGEVKRTVYDLTKDTFVVEDVADGLTELLDVKYYGGPSYSVIFRDGTDLHLLAHDWTQPKVANAVIDGVVNVGILHGDLARMARCFYTRFWNIDNTDMSGVYTSELVPREDYEDGWLNTDEIRLRGIPNKLYFGGQYVAPDSTVSYYYMVEYTPDQAEDNDPGLYLCLKSGGRFNFEEILCPWAKAFPLFVGRYLTPDIDAFAVFTGVGVFHEDVSGPQLS